MSEGLQSSARLSKVQRGFQKFSESVVGLSSSNYTNSFYKRFFFFAFDYIRFQWLGQIRPIKTPLRNPLKIVHQPGQNCNI